MSECYIVARYGRLWFARIKPVVKEFMAEIFLCHYDREGASFLGTVWKTNSLACLQEEPLPEQGAVVVVERAGRLEEMAKPLAVCSDDEDHPLQEALSLYPIAVAE